MDLNEIGNGIRDYQFNTKGDQTLRNWTKLYEVWPLPSDELASDNVQLHIYVTLPTNAGSPTRDDTTGEYFTRPLPLLKTSDEHSH